MTVTGTGFTTADSAGGCQITAPALSGLLIDTTGQTCTVSGTTGQLTAHFKVGANSFYTGAPVVVTVKGLPSTDTATATFTVMPKLVLSQASAAPGTFLSYGGAWFSNTASLGGACALGGPDITGIPVAGAPAPTCFQDASGNVNGQFTVLLCIPPGFYIVTYTDAMELLRLQRLSPYWVVRSSLSHSTPAPTGTTVTVTGSGFNCSRHFRYYHNRHHCGPRRCLPVLPEYCAVLGFRREHSFRMFFHGQSNAVGTAPPGYTLIIKGSTGDPFIANFLVATTFFVNPNNGGVNTANIQLSGSGYLDTFVPAACPALYESPAPLSAAVVCNIDAFGVLTGTMSINAAAVLGAHSVGINSAAAVVQTLVTTTFTVTQPTLTLTPNTVDGWRHYPIHWNGFQFRKYCFHLDGCGSEHYQHLFLLESVVGQ